jgi:Leucine-rich repeat (LRR) protein
MYHSSRTGLGASAKARVEWMGHILSQDFAEASLALVVFLSVSFQCLRFRSVGMSLGTTFVDLPSTRVYESLEDARSTNNLRHLQVNSNTVMDIPHVPSLETVMIRHCGMTMYETISDRPLTKLRGVRHIGIEDDPGE